MTQQIALITGATNGIGKGIAKNLASKGLKVYIVGRNEQRTLETLAELQAINPEGEFGYFLADLSLTREVIRLADEVKATLPHIDMLVFSAGLAPREYVETEEGIERTLAVGYLHRFTLTNLLVDILQASPAARILLIGQPNKRDSQLPYDNMNVKEDFGFFKASFREMKCYDLFVVEMAERLQGSGVTINLMGPGVTDTQMLDGFGRVAQFFINTFARPFMKSPDEAAIPAAEILTSDAYANTTGQLLSPLKPIKLPDDVRDPENRRRLWEASEKMTGLSFPKAEFIATD